MHNMPWTQIGTNQDKFTIEDYNDYSEWIKMNMK